MEGKLTDIAAGKLLEKFGAGSHKPGSGSASAFLGMLSAQMLRTVIDLTNDPKRIKTYSDYLPELLRIKNEIETRILPELEKLFQMDSEQFDKVITLREHRDIESDPLKKQELSVAAREQLKVATEIPLDIADLCLELADFAAFTFDHGFKSARGDAGVALNSAISAVASCLSIIELNLTTLNLDERTEKIRQRKAGIKSRYESLSPSVSERLAVLEKESNDNRIYQQSISEFQRGNLADTVNSNADIEQIVRRLQNTLWLQRDKVWKRNIPENPLQVLDPEKVLTKMMEYTYLESVSLGTYELDGDFFEVAGLIDKKKKLIQVSKNFTRETQNFTAAHELGHAILHKQVVLHRDRQIDGSTTTLKSREEMQADKFATYFLMPSILVKDVFFEIFEMQQFTINENTVLAIGGGNINALRQKCQNLRGLGRLLSSTEHYAGKTFNALAKIFNVSVETMAIRLEELDLIKF